MDITVTGGDMLAQLTAGYQACGEGETLCIKPSGGHICWLSGTLPFFGTKRIHVEAIGVDFRLLPPFAGSLVCYGAPLGSRVGGLRWDGGIIEGSFLLQNAGNCRITPDTIYGSTPTSPAIIINTDTAAPYSLFEIVNGVENCGPAIEVRQLNKDAWANAMTFRKTPFGPAGPVLNIAPAPGVTPQWPVDVLLFDDCPFEVVSGSLFNSVQNHSATFRDCYFEADKDWTMGKYGAGSDLRFRGCRGNLAWIPASMIGA